MYFWLKLLPFTKPSLTQGHEYGAPSSVTLCRWPAKLTIHLSVLVRNHTKGFGLEISVGPEVVTGREKRVGWTKELEAVGDGTRTEAVDSGHRSREASQHDMRVQPQ